MKRFSPSGENLFSLAKAVKFPAVNYLYPAMCTVTYIPTDNGFILSSNRDESPTRAINHLDVEVINGQKVIYPKDTKGGSWLFLSESGQVICVLNGAFIKHSHTPPYRKSRGLIAKSYFTHSSPKAFFQHIDLHGIEPFTLIVADAGKLYEFRWDESAKHIRRLDPDKAHIWSSSTLYTPEIQGKRKEWFENYLKDHSNLTISDAKYIHRHGHVGDPTQNYIMNRNNIVCTVSISHVIVSGEGMQFEFSDIIEHQDEAPLIRKFGSVASQ